MFINQDENEEKVEPETPTEETPTIYPPIE